jgi:hypothetical protein
MTPENEEDVSYGYVPGSTGTAGAFAVAWAPRRTPASDKARREALDALDPILSKHRPEATRRAPVRSESYHAARAAILGGKA